MDLKSLYCSRPRDENTARAEDGGLFYIKFTEPYAHQRRSQRKVKGNIGVFGYGAGNAMATQDGIHLAGGYPANFLDGGGGANLANSKLAIQTLASDPDVSGIFVNSLGGITQTDVVAKGVVEAYRENKMTIPVVVRLRGTGSEEAKQIVSSAQTVIGGANGL